MTITDPRHRAWARNACRLVALGSAAMLLVSSWILVSGGRTPAGAVTNEGGLVLTPTSGNSDTVFQLEFAAGVSTLCPGDSATDGYRVQGFLVPAGTDVGALTFTSVGPAGGQALLDPTGNTPFVNQQTDITTGNVSQLPASFTFAYNAAGDFTAGSWTVGVACTQGTGAGMVKSFWTAALAIADDAANGGGLGFTWAATTPPPSSTTTTDGSTTTTDGSTTTTDGSTTTTGGSGTTTTIASSVLGSNTTGGSPSSASTVSTMGQLPYTGSSPLPLVFWAVCLLVFGRMAMLLGKRPKVVGDEPS